MKKLFTLIAFIGFAIGANAQRHADVQVLKIYAPISGTKLTAGQKFPILFTFKNLGPDSIKVTDTMQLYLGLNGTTSTTAFLNVYYNAAIHVGDTASFLDTSAMYEPSLSPWSGYHSDSARTFCVNWVPKGTTSDPLTDPVLTNNASCGDTIIMLDVNNVNMAVNSLSVYPNPAQSNVNIDLNLNRGGNVTVSIMDVTGRMVLSEDKGKLNAGNHKLSFNTADLSNGVYIYHIMVDNEATNGRFSIAK